MRNSNPQKCTGCGVTLTWSNRALDMPHYCGECAKSAQKQSDSNILPDDMTVEQIAQSSLSPDIRRLSLVAIIALLACFAGVILAVFIEEDSINKQDTAIRASWLFCIIGVLIGKLIFLRKGSALTFCRWTMFWHWFIGCYFAVYIPLAILVPRYITPSVSEWALRSGLAQVTSSQTGVFREEIRVILGPIPSIALSAISFLPACIMAYVAAIIRLAAKDRTLKSQLCARCRIPQKAIEFVRAGNVQEAKELLSTISSQSQGLIGQDNLEARLYVSVACQELDVVNNSRAIQLLRKATEIDSSYVLAKFHLARALADSGDVSEACRLLKKVAADTDDPDLDKTAKKLARRLRRQK